MKIVDVNLLQRHFARIGARTQVRWLDRLRNPGSVALDITRDSNGELFDIQVLRGDSPERSRR